MIEENIRDWLFAIEDARQGLLAPHWQQAYIHEMEQSLEPEACYFFLPTLRAAIQSRPQISDEDSARQELARSGSQLLFFFEHNYRTMVELVFVPMRHIYTVYLALDLRQSNIKIRQDAWLIEERLDIWRREQGLSFDKTSTLSYPAHFPTKQTYSSLEQALNYLYTVLHWPELL